MAGVGRVAERRPATDSARGGAVPRGARVVAAGAGVMAASHVGLPAMGLWVRAVPVLAVVVPATAATARAVERAAVGHVSGDLP